VKETVLYLPMLQSQAEALRDTKDSIVDLLAQWDVAQIASAVVIQNLPSLNGRPKRDGLIELGLAEMIALGVRLKRKTPPESFASLVFENDDSGTPRLWTDLSQVERRKFCQMTFAKACMQSWDEQLLRKVNGRPAVMFQTTRPCGARRRAPRCSRCRPLFQSTRPCGARPPSCRRSRPSCISFNPRAPAGRDAKERSRDAIAAVFQSTRPCGARPGEACVGCALLSVSIHAPLRGATSSRR